MGNECCKASGSWAQLSSCKSVTVGGSVRINSEFVSDDKHVRVMLNKGWTEVVRSLDDDGNLNVYFSQLAVAGFGQGVHVIRRHNFHNACIWIGEKPPDLVAGDTG